jgi:hypothetical protein
MSTNLDEVIGLCRYCTKPLGESPPPACASCAGYETRRITNIKQSDPYKKVWNSVEDEEAILLAWVKNGTLFVPTNEELARRHVSKARFMLRKARQAGPSADGEGLFEEALFHQKMARELFDKHQRNLIRSR